MGKVKCACANILSDVCWPDAQIGHLITSYSKDENREDDDMQVIECEQCGSLLIEDKKKSSLYD